MKAIRRILFAIRDPEARQQPGLAKAIQVARAFGATLELFHAINDPVFVSLLEYDDQTVDKLRERIEGETRIPLTRLCDKARKHGVQAEATVEWDYPPHEAIVRRVTASGAELVIAECHKGGRTRPWLIHLTDWELLRLSPVPVLLLKSAKPYRRPRVLAAVDPGHAHAKPKELDGQVVDAARSFGQALRGTLHMMHANYPTIVGLPVTQPAHSDWALLSYEELKDQERQAFDAFRDAMGVMRTRTHLVEGNPVVMIPRTARELGAGIVVMGALSRSGMERVFIGNTAERVLESLPCDVLVVKPDGFKARVDQAVRGMRVMAPPTTATLAS